MKQKQKNLKLVLAALILLVVIYVQQNPKSSLYPTSSPSPTPTLPPRILPSNLTSDELFILNPPAADASKSALQKHAETVKKLAKTSTTIEIDDCQPTPRVLKVKEGTEIEIKNKDNTNHWLIMDEDHMYEIPTQDSQTIKATFKYGTGDYGYVCKGVGLVGFLHVTP